MNEYLVITWADSVPVEDGLADAATDRGGQLLAAGPVHDASELDSRPAPAGLVIARFSTEEAARSWFDAVIGKLDGTTLLAARRTAGRPARPVRQCLGGNHRSTAILRLLRALPLDG